MRIQGIVFLMICTMSLYSKVLPSTAAFVRAPLPLAFASLNDKRVTSRRGEASLIRLHLRAGLHTPRMSLAGGQPEPPKLTVSTFNIWCPLFRRMNVTGETGSVEEVRESQFKDLYMERNRNIIKLLDELDSDVICLQEFWVDSQELVDLYQSHFSQRYSWSQLERTGQRGDGLVTLVKNNIKVRDCRNIIFRDLGDRVAMLVRLQIPVVGTDGAEDTGEVVVVNTHLLFPHKPYFSIIRLRELRKILGFLELYRLLHRRDLPILMAGDFNGCPDEATYMYMIGRNFSSSCEPDTEWITHKNHLNEMVCVDYVWLQNPSDRRGPIDHAWMDMVFRSTKERIRTVPNQELLDMAYGATPEAPPTTAANITAANITAYRETLYHLGFDVAARGLSDEDLKSLMVGPDQKFRDQDRVLDEKDLFSLCDINQSGGLDLIEFKKFIKTLGVPNTGGNVYRKIFNKIDKSGRGVIERAEFEEWWVQETSGMGSEASILSREAVEVAFSAITGEGKLDPKQSSLAQVVDAEEEDVSDSMETSNIDLSLERVKSELNPKNLEKGRWTFELSDHAVVTSEFLIKQPSRKDAGEVMEKDRVAEACNNLL